MTTTTGYEDKVEALIDASTLFDVLEAVSAVCDAKAAHITHNWQDGRTAETWTRAARQLRALLQRSQTIRSI